MKTIKLKERDLNRLVKKTINEQNNAQLYQDAVDGDAQALCMLCNMSYFSSSQRNKYCKCSTCTCSTGQIDNNLLCRLCNMSYFSSSQRNKYCKCRTCPCSAGIPTTTDLGVDKDFSGPSEFDSSDVYAKERPNIYDGTDGTKIKLKESQLLKEYLNCSDMGAEDCEVTCCEFDTGRPRARFGGCSWNGGPCQSARSCPGGTDSAGCGSVLQPDNRANDVKRKIDTVNTGGKDKITVRESQLINIIKRVIKERREGDMEYSVDRPHVCVKGECYKRKDAPGVSCNSGDDAGWGQGGKCFKSGRACRKNC